MRLVSGANDLKLLCLQILLALVEDTSEKWVKCVNVCFGSRAMVFFNPKLEASGVSA